MEIVYDDIIYSLQKAGGISEVFSQISKYMPGDVLHYIYDNANRNYLFQKVPSQKYIELQPSCISLKRYLPFKVHEEKPFIFHSSYYRISKNCNSINITTVHDFMYELYRHDLKSIPHKIQKKMAAFNSDGIICISNNTKKDLLRFYPKLNKPVTVIHNGYDDKSYFFKDTPRKKQIVYTGGRKGYKSFQLAVDIIKKIKDYSFIIVGGGDLSSKEQTLLSGIQYKKFDYMSSEEICDLYNTSFLLLYPSEYEGFGITPIEAQACGCIVACQMTSSLPEVVHDTAIPIIPHKIEDTIAMIRAKEDKEVYFELQKKGLQNSKRFSWKKTAEEYYSFYEQIFNQKINNKV